MELLKHYSVGTISVENGATTVSGSATFWVGQVTAGDILWAPGGDGVRIASIENANQLTLAYPWPGETIVDSAYDIRVVPVASEIILTNRELLARLRQGLWLTPNATGTLAERAAYDGARRGFIYMRTDVNPFLVYIKTADTSGAWSAGYSPTGPTGPQGPQGIVGPQGNQGWTIETEVVADGPSRTVLRVADFIGGQGTKPSGVGQYIGAGGLVATAAEAVNIKGNVGDPGPTGIAWRGAWDAGTEYVARDIVTDPDINGDPAAWISLTTNTNSRPRDNATDWSLFPGSFPAAADYGLITQSTETTRDYGTLA